MTETLQQQFDRQQFTNGYELVNGVTMHAENGERFQIPHDVLKKHVTIGHFVELPDRFRWLSMWQIKQLFAEDAWVNPHLFRLISMVGT